MAVVAAAALNTLPVQSNPAYSVRLALDRLAVAIARTEKVLAPSFWRKLLGGTTKDHARGVVALTVEEARLVRGVVSAARKAAFHKHNANSNALVGSADRVIKLLDQWRDCALEFEEAVFGSDAKLLNLSRKLITLCNDLKNPASGLH